MEAIEERGDRRQVRGLSGLDAVVFRAAPEGRRQELVNQKPPEWNPSRDSEPAFKEWHRAAIAFRRHAETDVDPV